jgi:hypothetical protein
MAFAMDNEIEFLFLTHLYCLVATNIKTCYHASINLTQTPTLKSKDRTFLLT